MHKILFLEIHKALNNICAYPGSQLEGVFRVQCRPGSHLHLGNLGNHPHDIWTTFR